MGIRNVLRRIRLRHKPFEETTFEGNPAYFKSYRWREVMWVEKEDGLHLYYNGRPAHPFGGRPIVYQKCSALWLSRLSQIKADIDGFWRHNKWWDREAKSFLNNRKVSEKALYYLKQVACKDS